MMTAYNGSPNPQSNVVIPSRNHVANADGRSLQRLWEADDEAVPVWHLHLGQSLGVHRVVVADELVQREDIGGQRVDLVVRQSPGLLPRHRAPGGVEPCRRRRTG